MLLLWNVSTSTEHKLPDGVFVEKMFVRYVLLSKVYSDIIKCFSNYISQYLRSLGRQTNPSLKWGGLFEKLFDLTPTLYGFGASDLPTMANETHSSVPTVNYPVGFERVEHRLIEGSKYAVKMYVIDSYGCRGPDGSIIISSKLHDSISKVVFLLCTT